MKTGKIGDKVKVFDPGEEYSLYSEWVEQNAPAYLEKWKETKSKIKIVENGTEGIVRAVAPHDSQDDTICLIETEDNKVFLVSVDGLKKLNR